MQITEKSEIDRLNAIFKDVPESKKEFAKGLIIQAARHRVRLNKLWEDIKENGEYMASDNGVEHERPASKTYNATDKLYQGVMLQLSRILPQTVEVKEEISKLEKFRAELEDAE